MLTAVPNVNDEPLVAPAGRVAPTIYRWSFTAAIDSVYAITNDLAPTPSIFMHPTCPSVIVCLVGKPNPAITDPVEVADNTSPAVIVPLAGKYRALAESSAIMRTLDATTVCPALFGHVVIGVLDHLLTHAGGISSEQKIEYFLMDILINQ